MRVFLVVLLVSVAYPGFAALHGALHGADAGILAWSSRHLPLVWAGAASAVFVALLALERPRAQSARAYFAQLRERFRSVQREFERAVDVARAERKRRELDQPAHRISGPTPEGFDGLQAADHKRR